MCTRRVTLQHWKSAEAKETDHFFLQWRPNISENLFFCCWVYVCQSVLYRYHRCIIYTYIHICISSQYIYICIPFVYILFIYFLILLLRHRSYHYFFKDFKLLCGSMHGMLVCLYIYICIYNAFFLSFLYFYLTTTTTTQKRYFS